MAAAAALPDDIGSAYCEAPGKRNYVHIYPQYINAKRTKEEGRRTSKANSVENPTAQEIRDVCQAYGFEVKLEPSKRYPRDADKDPNHIGRVLVRLKTDDGLPCNNEYDTKLKLLNMVGQRIPKLTSRETKKAGGSGASGGGGGAPQSESGANQGGQGGGGGNPNKKKKGGKKR